MVWALARFLRVCYYRRIMREDKQKYELLLLLPLTGTDEELKKLAVKVEERIIAAGGVIHASTLISKGRLAYAIDQVRQGYYQAIQFEMEPRALTEVRQSLTLSGAILRFTIAKIIGEFKAFVPSTPKAVNIPARSAVRPLRPLSQSGYSSTPRPVVPVAASSTAPSPLAQETVKPSATPQVSMEELDKRLEEILGE